MCELGYNALQLASYPRAQPLLQPILLTMHGVQSLATDFVREQSISSCAYGLRPDRIARRAYQSRVALLCVVVVFFTRAIYRLCRCNNTVQRPARKPSFTEMLEPREARLTLNVATDAVRLNRSFDEAARRSSKVRS